MRRWWESTKTVNEKVVCKLWGMRGPRGPGCEEDYSLGFRQEKGFRWQLGGSPHWELSGLCIPLEEFLSSPFSSSSPFLVPTILEALGLPGRALSLSLLRLHQSWELGWVSKIFNLAICTRVRVVNIHIPALCAAGFQLPEGMKILTSAHAENLLLTPMLHFLKIHSQKSDNIFTAFSSLATWFKYLRGYFTFSCSVFPGLFKIDFAMIKNKSFSW